MAKSKKPKSSEQKPTESTPQITNTNGAEKDEKPASQAVLTQPEASDFESFYLQQVTSEFADDLDKIRNANDFSEKSLPVLVAALKQGVGMYSEEERRKVTGNS